MPLATNAEILQSQLAACLAVVNNTGMLMDRLKDSNQTDISTEPEIALELTILAACDRIEKILKDDSRWSVPAVDGHLSYAEIARHQAEDLKLTNQLKGHDVFVAEFNQRAALKRFNAATQTPTPPKNEKRKK